MTHILGLATLGAICLNSIGCLVWLCVAERQFFDFTRRFKVPKVVDEPITFTPDNFVGGV